MKINSIIPLCVLMFSSTVISHRANAAGKDFELKSMKGMKGVRIFIGGLDSKNPIVADGLMTEAQIRTDVELRLRQSGIPIKPFDGTTGKPSHDVGIFSVNVQTLKYGTSSYVFRIQVELYQTVQVIRDATLLKSGIFTSASTWESNYYGLASVDKVSEMRRNLDDRIDEFCNDYLATHPIKK